MVFCAYVIPEQLERRLVEEGVRDSKELSPQRRTSLNRWLRSLPNTFVETLQVSAVDIDIRRRRGENLNEIELICSLELLKTLKAKMAPIVWHHLYIDSVTSDERAW